MWFWPFLRWLFGLREDGMGRLTDHEELDEDEEEEDEEEEDEEAPES